MTTADAVRDDTTPEQPAKPEEATGSKATAPDATGSEATGPDATGPGAPRRLAPISPATPAAWLLRSSAIAAAVAGILAAIVAPGVQGNASEHVVVWTVWGASAFAFFLLLLLVTLAVWGAVELLRSQSLPSPARAALLGGGAVVVAMSSPGLRDRLPPLYSSIIAIAAVIAALAGAYAAAGAPHTRAVAAVLAVLAFAAMARFGAWWIAVYAGDMASVRLFSTARSLATAGILLEAAAQLLAVTWLSTRSRGGGLGQLGAFVALVGAVALTWGVAQGVHSTASLWQAILHTALADAPGVPSPYGLDALATFLVPASLLLALATAMQPRQAVSVLVAMALALVSRGAFDAPLRALCAVVAAYWVVLARGDQQAMWQALIRERHARLEEAK
ncbi:MAG TPA: hypothetical protein VK762_05400 [Polyangiaceae bacterium]|jgi:hypothetical protein|nr:hypothetical protein [Polyangiaceae bacterium]